jgi:phospholipid/cholesterol/gamma-HCH transport system substrate-binding protein
MQNKPNAEPFVRRHRPIFVGLFVLVPVITVPALLIFTMLKSDSLQKWCTLHVFYEHSQGLKKGNQVSMSGIAIGHVKDVDLVREKVVYVRFDINSRYRHLVRKDTKARLQQRGFVGDWEIMLTGGTAGAREVEDNDTLKSEKTQTMDDLIELAVGIIDTGIALLNDVAAIVSGIEAGEGTVGQLLKNDELFRSVNRHVDRIGANAVGITANVRTLTADAQGTVRGVDTLLAALTGAGKGGAAFVDTLMALVNTVNKSVEEVEAILKNVKAMSGEAPELMDRLQHDLGEVETMLRTLQDGWLFKSIGGGAPGNPHLADTP